MSKVSFHTVVVKNRHKTPAKEAEAYADRSKLYGHKWRQARAIFLRRNPLCCQCKLERKLMEATEVDHIVPHRGNMALFWDKTNWQALCKRHHSIKTAREVNARKQSAEGSSRTERPDQEEPAAIRRERAEE